VVGVSRTERTRTETETRAETEASLERGARMCPECGEKATGEDEITCVGCGLVLAENALDRGPEWRRFDNDEPNPARAGPPRTATRHDNGLSTVIGRYTDAAGNWLTARKKRQLNRIREHHKRFDSKLDENQAVGLTEISRLCSALDAGKGIQEQASRLFTTAQKADLLRGRSIEAIAAAAVYATLRANGVTRPLGELFEHAAVSRRRVFHCYRVINRELADLASDTGIANGRSPSGVAAGCVYLAADQCRNPVTQQAAAEIAGVSTATLRETYQALAERPEVSVP
jgi:transcription initiation factor TFIIB